MTLLRSAFINIINISIAASFLMLAVILLRPFLKRVPKWLVCVLWALVAVRLVVPFSLESRWSLVPAWKVSVAQGEAVGMDESDDLSHGSTTETGQGENAEKSTKEEYDAGRLASQSSGKAGVDLAEENAAQSSGHENDGEHASSMVQRPFRENEEATSLAAQQGDGQSEILPAQSGMDEGASANESMLGKTLEGVLLTVGSSVWLVGIIAMLAYFAISFVRVRSKVRTAARLETSIGVKVWMSDAINEPFVLGIVRPRIYLPSNLGEEDLECVLCHERAHVKRGDYLWKPLGFLILCVYWFHPLCWISYLLFCRDVEMACDEKATKDLSKEERKQYCQTLLNLGQGNKSFLTGTVAFGENGTKSRIKAVLNYKKPTFWVILVGVFACLAVGIFFMTSPMVHPKEAGQPVGGENVDGTEEGQKPEGSEGNQQTPGETYQDEGDKGDLIGVSEKEFNEIYEFMQEFMTFPVIWDFDQQNMSGAVDYFTQKWVWTDVTDLEYDVGENAFYVSASDFAEKMGQYFVMSDSARKAIEQRAQQGRVQISADKYLPWFWGFSFGIDRVEIKGGAYYVHGFNAEVTENSVRNNDTLRLGGYDDPFLEFHAVVIRDEGDGKLRLVEMDGLESGPGRKANVSEISDAVKKELDEFAELFAEGPVLKQYDLNNLTEVFDFAAQKTLQTHPEVVRERDDGRCVVPLSELMSFMEQHFYLPKGYERCLPKEGEGADTYPCLGEDGVLFLKKEASRSFELRTDLPTIQNERYYSFGVYFMDGETRENELAVLGAVRGHDGKLRLLYFIMYDL